MGTAGLVTQTGDKMVGGVITFKQWKGTLVLLPPPDFEQMARERENIRFLAKDEKKRATKKLS